MLFQFLNYANDSTVMLNHIINCIFCSHFCINKEIYFPVLEYNKFLKSPQTDCKIIFLNFLNVKEKYNFNAAEYSVLIVLQHCVCTVNGTNFTNYCT